MPKWRKIYFLFDEESYNEHVYSQPLNRCAFQYFVKWGMFNKIHNKLRKISTSHFQNNDYQSQKFVASTCLIFSFFFFGYLIKECLAWYRWKNHMLFCHQNKVNVLILWGSEQENHEYQLLVLNIITPQVHKLFTQL